MTPEHSWKLLARRIALAGSLGGLLVATAPGCGRSKPAATTDVEPPAATEAAAPKPGTSPAATASAEPTPATAAKSDERKWLGKIPYDVWFDDPLAVASNSQQVALPVASTAATPAAPMPSATTTDTPAPAASGGTDDWKAFISGEGIQEEVKRVRNRLTTSLQSQGSYNGTYKEIQADGAVIAALAALVERHPENISWKPNAKFVRDLGGQLRESSQALGKDGYEKSQAVFEKITSILSGSLPPDVGEAAAERPFGEVADRVGVMQRMQKGYEWLSSNITSEGKLKSEADNIAHEAAVLAALSKVVSQPSYESAEEDDYKKHATAMVGASLDALAASKDQDFAKFGDSLSRINKACSQCHADYRFAE